MSDRTPKPKFALFATAWPILRQAVKISCRSGECRCRRLPGP
jgi:hypothetical protein